MGKGDRMRASRLRCIPSHMPAVREAMVEHMEGMEERAMGASTPFERILMKARPVSASLRSASLWYVSRDMTEVAKAAAEGAVPRADPPTQSGLMFFGSDVSADARRLWGLFWVDYGASLFVSAVSEKGGGSLGMEMEHDCRLDGIARAVWALSLERTVCEVREGADALAPRNAGKPDPMARTVKMVVLREGDRSSIGGCGGRACCDHRFIVRGFWRNQPCGPNRSERRMQWIPPFVKGPLDAPLVVRDTVNVWRR